MNLQQIIEALSQPGLYPHRPETVEVRQTHASVAFLAGDEVYKLKKPVDLGFLDYSTVEKRARMCELEVELNRRLAPEVYLGVVEIVERDGRLRIGGEGDVIDHLVRMRRLPDDRSLSNRVRQGLTDRDEIAEVAKLIAGFHQKAERNPQIDRYGDVEAVARNVNENFEQTSPYAGRIIPTKLYVEIRDYALAFLRERQGVFEARIDAGRICDGHGDLRAEHVYILPERTAVIDCIEFNERMRYGDAAIDIAFLAMDLRAHGVPDLATYLIGVYQDAAGDDLSAVLDFYCCYRAYVRGKVACFLTDDEGASADERHAAALEAKRFFHLAQRYAIGDRRPLLVLMSGVSGTGKSTLAEPLAGVLAAGRFDSDSARKQLAGVDPSSRQSAAPGAGIYTPAMSKRAYAEILRRAEEQLAGGRSALLDATYIRRADRDAAREAAARHGARFLAVECDAGDQVVRERISLREQDPLRVSDAHLDIYLSQRAAFEPLDEIPAPDYLHIDTALPLQEQIDRVLTRV